MSPLRVALAGAAVALTVAAAGAIGYTVGHPTESCHVPPPVVAPAPPPEPAPPHLPAPPQPRGSTTP